VGKKEPSARAEGSEDAELGQAFACDPALMALRDVSASRCRGLSPLELRRPFSPGPTEALERRSFTGRRTGRFGLTLPTCALSDFVLTMSWREGVKT